MLRSASRAVLAALVGVLTSRADPVEFGASTHLYLNHSSARASSSGEDAGCLPGYEEGCRHWKTHRRATRSGRWQQPSHPAGPALPPTTTPVLDEQVGRRLETYALAGHALQPDEPGSPGWQRFHEQQSQPGALCAGADVKEVRLQLVHVPKAGGSTLSCSFSKTRKQGQTGCPRPNGYLSFEGERHETYYTLVNNRKCEGLEYHDQGSNCKPLPAGRCQPLITMMAHPVDRFAAAFYQMFGADKAHTGPAFHCGFLGCQTNSTIRQKYLTGQITLEEMALWPLAESELKGGVNEATKFFSLDEDTHGGENRMYTHFLANDDNEALAKAKRRMDGLDFVGLSSRYLDSIELLSWKLGVPMYRLCSCNVNLARNPRLDTGASLSAEAKARVMALNRLDAELYEHAVKRFELDWEQYLAAVDAAGHQRNPFRCHKARALCLVQHCSSGRGTCKALGSWVPVGHYRQMERRWLEAGAKSECSFLCMRQRPLGRVAVD